MVMMMRKRKEEVDGIKKLKITMPCIHKNIGHGPTAEVSVCRRGDLVPAQHAAVRNLVIWMHGVWADKFLYNRGGEPQPGYSATIRYRPTEPKVPMAGATAVVVRDLLQRWGLLRTVRRHGVDHGGRLALLGIEYTSIMTARTTKDQHNGWLLIPFYRSWPGVAGAVMAGV